MNKQPVRPNPPARSVDGIQRVTQPLPKDASKRMSTRPRRTVGILAGAFVVVAIGLLVAWHFGFIGSFVKKNQYQAVFLTNGQVYYGKLHGDNGTYVRLSDVYYLKGESSATASPTTQQLVKLGTEIHGPDAEMMIRNNQVLFFENLRADSSIVKAIEGTATAK